MDALPCKYPTKRSGIKNVSYASNQAGTSSMQQILTTPQSKSGKKVKKGIQGSDKALTGGKDAGGNATQGNSQS